MKKFQKLIAAIMALVMAIVPSMGCAGSNPANSRLPSADIDLSGTSAEVASQLSNQYDTIAKLAQNPGQAMSIAVGGDKDNPVIVKLSFNREGKAILTRADGAQALLELGLDGLQPVIRLVEARSGKMIAQNATRLAMPQQFSAADWVQAGIVAAGAAIIAWLGIKVIELTVVGIGYLAVVAIVVSAAVITGGIVAKVFNTLGWRAEDFINLFRQSASDLAAIITGAIQKFRETYNLG